MFLGRKQHYCVQVAVPAHVRVRGVRPAAAAINPVFCPGKRFGGEQAVNSRKWRRQRLRRQPDDV